MVKIFVYGSLREGMYNYDIYLANRIKKSEPAYVKGQLYSLVGKTYPALVSGNDWVMGEIISIEDTNILTELDKLEEWYGENNIENEYDKTLMRVYDNEKQYIDTLIVYTFNMKKPTHQNLLDKQIESGNYVSHYKQINTLIK